MVSLFKYPKRRLRNMIKKGQYAEALDYGRSIESNFAEDHDYLFIMGSVHYILEEPSSAIPYFDRAISLQHDDIEALILKTNSHLALKDVEDAIACCMHILKLDPEHRDARSLLNDLQNHTRSS